MTDADPIITPRTVGVARERERIKIRVVDPDDALIIGGGALSATAMTWLVYGRRKPA